MRAVLVIAVIFTSHVAHADDAASAAATALFAEGRKLVKEGKYAEACPKFEASLKLEHTNGTLFSLADCYAQVGRTASAYARYNEVIERFKHDNDDRLPLAQKNLADLTPRLAWLTIRVADAARVPGLQITRNNAVVPEALFDNSVPVDPGQYAIVVSATGYQPVSKTVVLPPAGGREIVQIVALVKLPEPVVERVPDPAPPQPVATDPAPADPRRDKLPRGSERTTQQNIGAIGVAVGGSAVAASLVLGLQARSKWSLSEERCMGTMCSAEGVKLANEAKSRANLATASFLAGAVIAIAGAITYGVAPKPPSARQKTIVPVIDRGGAGVVLTGSF